MPSFVRTVCGARHADSETPPAACRIGEEPRRFVKAAGPSRVGRESAAMRVVKRMGAGS
jgi:hypothetical protein